tara:strand:+ start:108 stop:500 length:393 start_codon:yes stop_codon:yes gene_type:complete
MAEGIFKKLIGSNIFVQSAGIYDSLEIDGFTVRVCDEIGVKLNSHRVRSLKEVEKLGGFIGSFDLIIPMTQKSFQEVKSFSKYVSVEIESWKIREPEKNDLNLEETLDSYRSTRDLIYEKIFQRFKDFLI